MEKYPLYKNILNLLKEKAVAFHEIKHMPINTSDEALEIFGYVGADTLKTIALDSDILQLIITLTIDERIDFKQLKTMYGVTFRFMERSKIQVVLGAEPGGLSPFGYNNNICVLITYKAYMAKRILINPGRRDLTLNIDSIDFKRLIDTFNISILL